MWRQSLRFPFDHLCDETQLIFCCNNYFLDLTLAYLLLNFVDGVRGLCGFGDRKTVLGKSLDTLSVGRGSRKAPLYKR
jgi:hypothetical protein